MNKATKSDINQQASDESNEWPLDEIVDYMCNRPSSVWESELRNEFEIARRDDLEYDCERGSVDEESSDG